MHGTGGIKPAGLRARAIDRRAGPFYNGNEKSGDSYRGVISYNLGKNDIFRLFAYENMIAYRIGEICGLELIPNGSIMSIELYMSKQTFKINILQDESIYKKSPKDFLNTYLPSYHKASLQLYNNILNTIISGGK